MMFDSWLWQNSQNPPPVVPSVNGTCITCHRSVSLENVSHFAIGMISSNNASMFFVEKALSVWSGSNPPFSCLWEPFWCSNPSQFPQNLWSSANQNLGVHIFTHKQDIGCMISATAAHKYQCIMRRSFQSSGLAALQHPVFYARLGIS